MWAGCRPRWSCAGELGCWRDDLMLGPGTLLHPHQPGTKTGRDKFILPPTTDDTQTRFRTSHWSGLLGQLCTRLSWYPELLTTSFHYWWQIYIYSLKWELSTRTTTVCRQCTVALQMVDGGPTVRRAAGCWRYGKTINPSGKIFKLQEIWNSAVTVHWAATWTWVWPLRSSATVFPNHPINQIVMSAIPKDCSWKKAKQRNMMLIRSTYTCHVKYVNF